jgi:quercetin dioxygenase-like cupin family protein
MHRKIDFNDLPWQQGEGMRYKQRRVGGHKIRLAEFSSNYVEKNWCHHWHTGYVVEGRITITFPDKAHTYERGDGIVIQGGDESKHKASVADGETATLILFEPN